LRRRHKGETERGSKTTRIFLVRLGGEGVKEEEEEEEKYHPHLQATVTVTVEEIEGWKRTKWGRRGAAWRHTGTCTPRGAPKERCCIHKRAL